MGSVQNIDDSSDVEDIFGSNESSPVNLEGNEINKISEEDSYDTDSDKLSNSQINESVSKA